MEMESNLIMKNQKLEAFDILRKAVIIISFRNINFVIFTILTFLPLFCFLVYYESLFQKFQFEISEILKQPIHYRNSIWLTPFHITNKLNKEFPNEFIQLGLLYLVPLHLLELSTALVIVDLASKIYTEERPKMTLKDMVHEPFDRTRLKGTFITSVYVLILSTCTRLWLIWLATTYYVVFGNMDAAYLAVYCWPSLLALLTMYLGWSAVWNVSLVISILEGNHGAKALALAIYYSIGNEWRGFLLMLIFFAWEVSLRFPCIYIGCREIGNGLFAAQISFFCLGNVLKWVVFMVYFFDCKNRALEKKLMMKFKKRGESG